MFCTQTPSTPSDGMQSASEVHGAPQTSMIDGVVPSFSAHSVPHGWGPPVVSSSPLVSPVSEPSLPLSVVELSVVELSVVELSVVEPSLAGSEAQPSNRREIDESKVMRSML